MLQSQNFHKDLMNQDQVRELRDEFFLGFDAINYIYCSLYLFSFLFLSLIWFNAWLSSVLTWTWSVKVLPEKRRHLLISWTRIYFSWPPSFCFKRHIRNNQHVWKQRVFTRHCASKKNLSEKSHNCGFLCMFV